MRLRTNEEMLRHYCRGNNLTYVLSPKCHRDPETLEIYTSDNVSDLPLMGRGYSGHEHLPWFGLINMNARLYDPAIAQFISPDPYIQDIENSQNHNRYSYALNNPLMYRDENGEFFMTIFTAFTDLVGNLFKHGFHISRYNWKRTENAWKIDAGMFKGNFGQILHKWTLGLVNSSIGNATAHVLNIFGAVDDVTEMDGMLAISGVTGNSNSTAAFTLGHYSFGPDGYTATWQNHLFVHEYGHYIQSQWLRTLYLPTIGLASLESAWYQKKLGGGVHHNRWFEVNASRLGAEHFDKKYGSGAPGYQENSPNYFNKTAFSKGKMTNYINPQTGKPNSYKDPDPHPIDNKHISFWDFIPFL